ncbi:AEC family transporter [Nitrospirillum sp. BR 11828]|uniref:AEC family transporter n=1 Tax=Nitrospirillum sp. BR 11828 TaxID=3104325 RepID=UPI002AC9F65C|nr:AEC family transporter [Nitrospirillum sp. BR 11828]MDZ5648330.1 AEC family transporter [Nitrospirillum sp. BR 11828]
MLQVLTALAPTFLLIAIGFALRRLKLIDAAFWGAAERLIYYLLFPALLIDSTAKTDLSGMDIWAMGGAMVGGILLVSLALQLTCRRPSGSDPAYTSVFQGAVRVNTYVAMALGAALLGPHGTALMAIGVLFCMPMANVLSILVMRRHGDVPAGMRGHPLRTLWQILSNPLVCSVITGAALNLAGIRQIPVVSPVMAVLGQASLPLGLLAVGAGLGFSAIRGAKVAVAISSAARLAVLPLVTALLARALGVEGNAFTAVVLYNALPTSVSAYVLARQMGGDAPLMAGIITVQTLAAAVTLPIVLALATG